MFLQFYKRPKNDLKLVTQISPDLIANVIRIVKVALFRFVIGSKSLRAIDRRDKDLDRSLSS